MIDETLDEPDEPSMCEECQAVTNRVCSRCGRRICRACATDHPNSIVEPWMRSEEQKPAKCAPITKAQRRALDRLPRTEAEIQRDGLRRKTYLLLIRRRLAIWDEKRLVRRG